MAESISLHGSRTSGPSLSLLDSNKNQGNGGVGNYKGVMLCNRPFAGSTGAAKESNGGEKSAFTCGVVPESIGVNVSITNLEKHIRRPKKETAITKHRKWLADLQKTKESLENQYAEELRRKKESQAKFAEREAKIRQKVRGMLRGGDEDNSDGYDQDNKNNDDRSADSKEQSSVHYELPGQPETESDAGSSEYKKNKSKSKSKANRPAWALTETAAKDDEDMFGDNLQGDEASLLAFASSLDIDRYLGDMEVKSMMERVRRRIAELEREVVQDERREKESEERAAKRGQAGYQSSRYDSDEEGEEEDGGGDETLRAAKALLFDRDLSALNKNDADQKDSSTFRNVHSTQSAAALLRAARDREREGGIVLNEPLIVCKEDDNGARLVAQKDISKLPYMHRNPAV